MTVEVPSTELPADTPIAADEVEVLSISRQRLNQVYIAVVFFALGFVAALGFAQITSGNTRAAYQQALDDAVAAVLAALPESSGAAQAAQPDTPDPNRRYVVSADDDPALGPEDAPVLIVEFSDFRCPYCGRFATTTLAPLLEHYGDQVRFVYRDFPILGDLSFQAALAAECADEQGAFWDYHDLVFANQQALSAESFAAFAEQLDLDTEAFQSCLSEQTTRDEVIADFNAARDLGASGTPTFFINGRFVSGAQPLPVFEGIIDEELAAINADG